MELLKVSRHSPEAGENPRRPFRNFFRSYRSGYFYGGHAEKASSIPEINNFLAFGASATLRNVFDPLGYWKGRNCRVSRRGASSRPVTAANNLLRFSAGREGGREGRKLSRQAMRNILKVLGGWTRISGPSSRGTVFLFTSRIPNKTEECLNKWKRLAD